MYLKSDLVSVEQNVYHFLNQVFQVMLESKNKYLGTRTMSYT